MDRGAWQATVHGVAKSWTQLSDFAKKKQQKKKPKKKNCRRFLKTNRAETQGASGGGDDEWEKWFMSQG